MTIQEKLVSLRREAGLSQRELALELKLESYSTYARVERNSYPDLLLLSKLSIHYGLTLSGILKDVGPIL